MNIRSRGLGRHSYEWLLRARVTRWSRPEPTHSPQGGGFAHVLVVTLPAEVLRVHAAQMAIVTGVRSFRALERRWAVRQRAHQSMCAPLLPIVPDLSITLVRSRKRPRHTLESVMMDKVSQELQRRAKRGLPRGAHIKKKVVFKRKIIVSAAQPSACRDGIAVIQHTDNAIVMFFTSQRPPFS